MNHKYRIFSIALSVILILTIGCFSAYAEPGDDSTVSSAVSSPDYNDSQVDPPQEPVTPVTPAEPENPDNNNDYSVPDVSYPDYNTPDDNQNYSPDNNGYTDGSVDFSVDDSQDDYYSPAPESHLSEPESRIEGNEPPTYNAQLYDVSSHLDSSTLSSDDWDLALDFNNGGDGTGDFNFIKKNNSSFDENFSIWILFLGIALIIISLIIIATVIITTKRKKKLQSQGISNGSASHMQKNYYSSHKNRVLSKGDTADIDISSFNEKNLSKNKRYKK